MNDKAEMPLNTSAYLADTSHLSTLEHGAYLLILMTLWRSSTGWIDGSDHYLARVTRMTLGRWKRIAPSIRVLLVAEGAKVSQKRVLRDRKAIPTSTQNVSPAGNQNSKPKYLKNNGPKPETPESGAPAPEPAISISPNKELDLGIKKERKRGQNLPESWQPREAELLYGRTVLKLTDVEIETAAEKMRRWAISNAHRDVARKSNWDMTFRNWLDSLVEGKGAGPRTIGGRGGNAFAALRSKLAAQQQEGETRS